MHHPVIRRPVEHLRGVVAVAEIKPQRAPADILVPETRPFLAVKVTDLIPRPGIGDHPFQVLGVSIKRNRKHADAFRRLFGDVLQNLPIQQVGGAPDAHLTLLAANLHDHHIGFARLMIQNVRIALPGVVALHVVDERLAAVDHRPGEPLVGAVGSHLEKRALLVLARMGGGEDGEKGFHVALLLAEGIELVHHGGARPDGVVVALVPLHIGIRVEDVGQLVPMHQVLAHRMTPGFCPAGVPLGVMLEAHVPEAVVIDHAIRVVEPAHARGEMELRSQGLIISYALIQRERRPLIGERRALDRDERGALGLVRRAEVIDIDEAARGGTVVRNDKLGLLALELAHVQTHWLHGFGEIQAGGPHPFLPLYTQAHSQQIVVGPAADTEGDVGLLDGEGLGDKASRGRVPTAQSGVSGFAVVILGGSDPELALNIAGAAFARGRLVALGGLHRHGIACGNRPIRGRSFFINFLSLYRASPLDSIG